MAKASSDLPTTVKVGWRDYRIINWEPKEAQSSRRYGETHHLVRELRIDMTFGTRQAASTLLHEIMHAVASIWNYSDSSKEEDCVSALGDGLSTVWRDNPDVLAWIGHHLVHGT